MTPLEVVLGKLPDARKRGDNYQARCRSHEDAKASLSIGTGDDGRVLLKCFAGCTAEQIVAGLGLTMRDLCASNGNGSRPHQSPRHEVKAYDYRDERGTLLYQAVRFEPKDFRQRRPDGHGGWIWDLKGVRLVVYRLPELLEAREIHITEGEKDADRLAALGFAATCNPMGALKWRDSYAEQLHQAGAERVVIWPDNDDPGRAHAAAVARSCFAAGLQVRRVTVPAPAKDVAEWLARGHTADDVRALVAGAPAWTPETEPAATANEAPVFFEAAPAFITRMRELPAPTWLVKGLLPADGIALWHGEPRTLKSWLALEVAVAVASGTAVAGSLEVPVKRPVLLVTNEDSPKRVAQRIEALVRGRGLDTIPEWLRVSVHRGLWLDDLGAQAALLKEVKAFDPGAVLLDPLRSVTGCIDKGPADLQPFALYLRELGRAFNGVVASVHHDQKPQVGVEDRRRRPNRASGGGLFSIADAPCHIERLGTTAAALVRPSAFKFFDDPTPLEVTLEVAADMSTARLKAEPTTASNADDLVLRRRVLAYVQEHPGKSGTKIVEALKLRRDAVLAVLNALADEGVLDAHDGKHGASCWFVRTVSRAN